MALVNLYEQLPAKYRVERSTYPAFEEIQIQIPARIAVVGPSSAGKTNVMLNLIMKVSAWSKIYLCVKMPDEPLYAWFIDRIREIEVKTKKHILTVVDDLALLPKVDEFSDTDASLVVFDDMITETDVKKVKGLKELWSRGRKQGKGITCIFLSQSFYEIPKFIRTNTDILLLKKLNELDDLKRILKTKSLGTSVKELEKMYISSNSDDIAKFFLIDSTNSDPKYRFRHNYTPIGGRSDGQW